VERRDVRSSSLEMACVPARIVGPKFVFPGRVNYREQGLRSLGLEVVGPGDAVSWAEVKGWRWRSGVGEGRYSQRDGACWRGE
jgi:hypothetical protein